MKKAKPFHIIWRNRKILQETDRKINHISCIIQKNVQLFCKST